MNSIKWFVKCVLRNLYRWYCFFDYKVLGNTDLQIIKDDKKHEYDVCVIIGYGWNFLDAQLPTLLWLKKKKARICTVIPFCNAYRMAQAERTRFEMLENVSDCLIVNMCAAVAESKVGNLKYDAKLSIEDIIIENVPKQIQSFQIKSFFSIDDSEILPLLRLIRNKFNKAFYVHGWCVDYFGIWGNNGYFNDDYYERNVFDCYLIPNAEGYRNVKKYRSKMCLVGAPRLDYWWRQLLINAEAYCALKKRLTQHNKKIIVHIFSVVVDYIRFTEHERDMYYRAMEELKDYFHVFKFHPRDTKEDREKFISRYIPDDIEWVELTEDFVQLFDLADLFLTVGSTSGSIGLLASGKPQIEFYDDSVDNRFFLKVSENRYVAYNEYHGLSIHANDSDELVKFIRQVLGSDLWEREYKSKASKLFNLDNCASERAADVLLSGKPKYTLDKMDETKWFAGF